MRQDYASNSVMELGIKSGGIASFVFMGKVVSVIIGGITFIIVARMLGASNYGLYTLALGVSGFFGAFASISVGPYFSKYIPEMAAARREREISGILGAGILLLLVFAVALTLIGIEASGIIESVIFHATGSTDLIIAAMSSILASIFFGNFYTILVSFGDGTNAAISSMINAVVQAVFSISLVYYGFGAFGAVVGYAMGLFIGMIYSLIFILKSSRISFGIRSIKRRMRDILSFSTPLTVAGVFNSLVGNFSVLFLGAILAPSVIPSIGSYGVASKIGNLIDIIIGSISAVLVPMFASALTNREMSKKIDKLYSYSIYFGFLFTTPFIVYLSVFSGQLVDVLFTSSYASAPFYIIITGVSILVGIVGMAGGALAISVGDVRKVFVYSVIVTVAQLISILTLVPAYGAEGLIVSMLLVPGVITDILYIRYVGKSLMLKVDYNIIGILASNAALVAVLLGVGALGASPAVELAIGILALAVLYPILLSLTGSIKRDDAVLLYKVGKNIPVVGIVIDYMMLYINRLIR
jgi:O-antigen/teichoic acid export membrane protein